MAGITGFYQMNGYFDTRGDSEKWTMALDGMCGALKHRGGHREARFVCGDVCLAQTSKSGEAAVRLPYKEGAAYIVMDGELFHSIGTADSPAEYVLRLILREGIDAIEQLNGAFAGAVYVEAERKLYLFRDHLGIKPLFVSVQNGSVVFGSEIKALLRYPNAEAVVTRDGLCEVLGLGPARREASGVFKGVQSVLPGHYWEWVFNDVDMPPKQVKYWEVGGVPCTDSFDEAAHAVAELLQDAVARQSTKAPGKRICTLLSGGLDSSLVTALLATDSTAAVDTFSFDFVDSEKHFKANDFQGERDRPYAERMSRLFGTRHTFLECDSDALADALTDAVKARDLPGMADIDSSLLVFARQVAETHDVALTGECADEIFNGYPWFHRADMVNAPTFPWSRDIGIRQAFLRDDVKAALDMEGFVREAYEASRAATPVCYDMPETDVRERELSYLTMKWIMATLVDRTDRMCAFAGLGARVPFADKRLAEYLWTVPWATKSRDGVKSLLRAAFKGLLPDALLLRKKNPYPKTYNPAYERILAARLRAVLADPNAPIRALADPAKVQAFIGTPSDYGKPWYGQLMAGPQMLAYWLQIDAWLREYRIRIDW